MYYSFFLVYPQINKTFIYLEKFNFRLPIMLSEMIYSQTNVYGLF